MTETAENRAARFHKMAADTRRLARRSEDPKVAAAYLELAEHWDRLAHGAAYGTESANDDAAEPAADRGDQSSTAS